MITMLKALFTQPKQSLAIASVLIPTWFKWLSIVVLMAFVVYKIYAYGVDTERTRWVNKTNTELVLKQQEVLRLTTLNRELERQATQQALKIATKWKGVLDANNQAKDQLIANLRTGAKRLSIPTKPASACAGGVGLAATTGPSPDQTPRAELSEEASRFLVGLSAESDEAIIEANHVKDLLLQCRAHVEALQAQRELLNH